MTNPDPLDDLLGQDPYAADGGFTDRVMARLPPPRRDWRPLVLGLSGLAASALAAIWLPAAAQGLAAIPPAWGVEPMVLFAWGSAAGALLYAASRLLGGEQD